MECSSFVEISIFRDDERENSEFSETRKILQFNWMPWEFNGKWNKHNLIFNYFHRASKPKTNPRKSIEILWFPEIIPDRHELFKYLVGRCSIAVKATQSRCSLSLEFIHIWTGIKNTGINLKMKIYKWNEKDAADEKGDERNAT